MVNPSANAVLLLASDEISPTELDQRVTELMGFGQSVITARTHDEVAQREPEVHNAYIKGLKGLILGTSPGITIEFVATAGFREYGEHPTVWDIFTHYIQNRNTKPHNVQNTNMLHK